ncbi:MAG: GNAT family N-acetyltransferase [Candidatus Peribacteraceae bacterium]
MNMKVVFVKHPAQLDILAGQKASYDHLDFSFSEKYLNQLKSLLGNKHSYQIILEDDGNFVGYLASAETLWSNHLTIIEVFVSPEYQGKGVGKILLSHAIEFAKKEGLAGLIVQTENDNVPAQKLYENRGFQKFENREWEGISYKLAL